MNITTSYEFTPAELSALRAMDAMSDVLTALNATGDTDGTDAAYFSQWQHQGPADNPGYYGRVHDVLKDMVSDFIEYAGITRSQPTYGPALTSPHDALVSEIMDTSLDQQPGKRISAAFAYVIRHGIATEYVS